MEVSIGNKNSKSGHVHNLQEKDLERSIQTEIR